MRHGIQALAVLLFFLAVLTVFAGRPRAGGMLAARVAQLEALVAEQQAELDKQPVVVDANGEAAGALVQGAFNQLQILVDREAVPLFLLSANGLGENVDGQTVQLFFSSSDCSGPPFLQTNTSDPARVFRTAFFNQATNEVYIGDGSPGAVREFISRLTSNGDCAVVPQSVFSQSAVFVSDDLTPPFEVVTRGDLLAGE